MDPRTPTVDKAALRRHFGRAARAYEATAVLQDRVGQKLMERLDFLRCTPDWILDLGAGTGLQSRRLNGRFPKARVIALDIARPMLLEARRRKGWRQRQLFCQGDAEALPLRPASMDLVYANLCLQWSDLDRSLREIARVLRPGGLLLFTTLGPDTLKELRQSFAAVDAQPHVHFFQDMHEVGDSLQQLGFVDPILDVDHFSLEYRQLADLLRELRGIGAGNALSGRARGLWTPRRWQALNAAYEAWRSNDRLPAHYEVIYAHAWASEPGEARSEDPAVASLRFYPRRPKGV
ncbi:malonyl-ACP O-methyltransferase BioC [Acidithiobacillus sp.]|uniref:malonyl-ACP O-methyltransferase BioC n=1 Tax=Acidithiobacillus sp. TaxID=1872118 RepID=UPI0025BFB0FC|nr:malonyl-ACP O-methyltransferase BioC [Acidithiobacillus sp.]